MTEPPLVVPWNFSADPIPLRTREWLVTNGLGGYASGTLLGVGTRRYHGVFIPNLPAPYGRMVLTPRLDEIVHSGTRTVQLGGAEFIDNRLEGESHLFLKEFRREGQTPVWIFHLDDQILEKWIVMPYGENTTYVAYIVRGGKPLQLWLRPYITFRKHDVLLSSPSAEGFSLLATPQSRYEAHFGEEDAPVLKFGLRPHCGRFVEEEKHETGILYRVERERGYDHVTALSSPGYFVVDLEPNKPVAFVVSTEPWASLDLDPGPIFAAEQHRVKNILALAPLVAQRGFAAQLVLAADQFIILPGSRPEEQRRARSAGEKVRTVIAGYPWFTDWGRDTMISLEGLTLCTGRMEEARAILRTFAQYIQDGLLPNHFPEGERTAIYNTVDATFWYFHALDRYYDVTRDQETLEQLYPILRSIIERHLQGTHFGIGVDGQDGLIKAGAEGYALTWMDAKVGDWVVTPRRGKPV